MFGNGDAAKLVARYWYQGPDRGKCNFAFVDPNRPTASARNADSEYIFEEKIGVDGRAVTAWRRIDRRRNVYRERVVRDDGTVIHEQEEPLVAHIGHGSAKA